MTNIDKDTANWRLFGGGGLLVGGLLWTIAAILGLADVAGDVAKWLGIIGLIVIGIGFVLVAWGQTGSNGAVGNNVLGKVALIAAGLGFLLWGIVSGAFGVANEALSWVVAVLIVLGTVLGAVIIQQKGVARGLAVWALFLVALAAILYFLGALGLVDALAASWVGLVFAIVVTLTGLLYLLNKK